MTDYILKVRLTELERKALETIVQRERDKFPLRPPSQSAIVRDWISAAFFACPSCDQPTMLHPDPSMVGVRFCEQCNESVTFDAL